MIDNGQRDLELRTFRIAKSVSNQSFMNLNYSNIQERKTTLQTYQIF